MVSLVAMVSNECGSFMRTYTNHQPPTIKATRIHPKTGKIFDLKFLYLKVKAYAKINGSNKAYIEMGPLHNIEQPIKIPANKTFIP